MNARFWQLTTITAAVTLGLVGCNGCEPPTLSPAAPAADDLHGVWSVAAYAHDDDGCEPNSDHPPYEQAVIEQGGEEDELTISLCPSAGHCPEGISPENHLTWDDDEHQATATHFSAGLADTSPERHECRLAMVQTSLTADNTRPELTRSYYELTLPVEGDGACTTELAEDHAGNMPCQRSKTAGLAVAEEESK